MLGSIDIYIEAVCLKSPGIARWGAFVSDGTAHRKLYGGEPESDHNGMSMTAAIAALEALENPCEVRLYTHSKYLCDAITTWIRSRERQIGAQRQASPSKVLTCGKGFKKRREGIRWSDCGRQSNPAAFFINRFMSRQR